MCFVFSSLMDCSCTMFWNWRFPFVSFGLCRARLVGWHTPHTHAQCCLFFWWCFSCQERVLLIAHCSLPYTFLCANLYRMSFAISEGSNDTKCDKVSTSESVFVFICVQLLRPFSWNLWVSYTPFNSMYMRAMLISNYFDVAFVVAADALPLLPFRLRTRLL